MDGKEKVFLKLRGFNLNYRWDPKKRMTPDEAARHEWLQPSSSSGTFIIPKSSSRDHLKENSTIDGQQNSLLQKYQRSHQPITPNTILPEIKTPSNRSAQRFTKERAKGEFMKYGDRNSIFHYFTVHFQINVQLF